MTCASLDAELDLPPGQKRVLAVPGSVSLAVTDCSACHSSKCLRETRKVAEIYDYCV